MAYAAGYLDGKVSHVISSAVSLFPEVRWPRGSSSASRVPVDRPHDAVDGRPVGAAVRHSDRLPVRRSWRSTPSGRAATRPCQVANFMYGSGWDTLLLHKDAEGHDWLDPDVHEWSARELGATPMSFIDQICESSRYGHIVPAQPRDPAWPANYLARPRQLQPPERAAPIHLHRRRPEPDVALAGPAEGSQVHCRIPRVPGVLRRPPGLRSPRHDLGARSPGQGLSGDRGRARLGWRRPRAPSASRRSPRGPDAHRGVATAQWAADRTRPLGGPRGPLGAGTPQGCGRQHPGWAVVATARS